MTNKDSEDIRVKEWMLAIDAYSLVHHWRLVKDMTQEELAERVGTQQSSIARLERGKYAPSLTLLIKVAHALGKELEIRFK